MKKNNGRAGEWERDKRGGRKTGGKRRKEGEVKKRRDRREKDK